MYWTVVFAVVALLTAVVATATVGSTAAAALLVSGVFAVLAMGSAAGAALARLR